MIERALGRKSQTGGKSSLKIVLWRSGGKLTNLLPFSGQHGTDMFSSVMRVVCVLSRFIVRIGKHKQMHFLHPYVTVM